MEDRFTRGRLHSWEVQLVDVPFHQAIDEEPRAHSVRRHGHTFDRRRRFIHLWAALARLENGGVGLDCVRGGIASRLSIQRKVRITDRIQEKNVRSFGLAVIQRLHGCNDK